MSRPLFAIRKAVPRDAEAMFAVHRASVHALCAKAYSAEHMASWFEGRTPEIYAPALAAEQIWVAEQSGNIVGFVGARPGEVTLLFVSPQAMGQGIGSGLFEHGLSVAEGTSSAPVTVVATKNSASFYAAHGFAAVGEQWFERGARSLRYPMVEMVREGRNQTPPDAGVTPQTLPGSQGNR
jgi:predicted N-acetyltransferase YhbS